LNSEIGAYYRVVDQFPFEFLLSKRQPKPTSLDATFFNAQRKKTFYFHCSFSFSVITIFIVISPCVLCELMAITRTIMFIMVGTKGMKERTISKKPPMDQRLVIGMTGIIMLKVLSVSSIKEVLIFVDFI
jgi:hypothetical protein|tara:strand:- start:3268 stop:3657 length:390 start_codon:yes stop_codon:yes gene_type:complete